MPIKNDQLRAAQHRTESPSQPGECLSRQELAELANAYIWDHHQKRVETDGNYLGKLERGLIRWPGKYYREALRALLGVSTDSQLGFSNERRAVVKLAPVDHNQFIRTLDADAVTLSPTSPLLEYSEPTPIPTRVSATDIEQIRTAARVFASWDHTYGGAWPATPSSPSCAGPPVCWRPPAHHDARRIFRFALASAEKAGDWHLRTKILSSMARQAIWTGQPDEGLTYAEHALFDADCLTATERAIWCTPPSRTPASAGSPPLTIVTSPATTATTSPTGPVFTLLRDIRELRMTCYVVQHATEHPEAHAEAQLRLDSLRGKNGPRPWNWTPAL